MNESINFYLQRRSHADRKLEQEKARMAEEPEYHEGFAAGERGLDPTANPYQNPLITDRTAVVKSVNWIRGFADAWYIRSSMGLYD